MFVRGWWWQEKENSGSGREKQQSENFYLVDDVAVECVSNGAWLTDGQSVSCSCNRWAAFELMTAAAAAAR